ncbi:MAG: efflux RND transporter periplasmic adaptor subunit [Gammaproteobacteria bacterium]|jgi:membrane fusion protein (multidrug efflux system)
MTKRLIVTLAALAVILGGIFGWKAWQSYRQSQTRGGGAPAATVTAKHAEALDWHPTLNAVGSLRAVNGVSVTTQLAGLVTELHFHSGQSVKKNDLLVQLQDAPERAKLASLQAKVEYARSEYARDQRLIKVKGVSQAQLQQAKSNLDDLRAQVKQQQATIDLKAIRAPFDGVVGIRQVDLGEFVNAGQKIVTLQALDPLLVEFSLPQGQVSKLHQGQDVTLDVDAWPGATFKGRISAINPEVDTSTRSVGVQARVPNPDHKLLPGMFVQTHVQLPARSGVVTLPETAVSYNPYGDYVYVLSHPKSGKGWVAHQVVVKTGATRGSQIEIRKGVKPGDYVVTTGQLKLHDGSPVKVNNQIRPNDEKNPDVPDA